AAGIVEGIARILRKSGVAPADVAFIAHSTTQATNALLEGDVARVGVVGIAGRFAWIARKQIRFAPVELAPGVPFAPLFALCTTAADDIERAVERLIECGAEAVAASAPFGVDRPLAEKRAVDLAAERGVFATSGHDVTSMYGLRARTRTAALNAAILPKMVRTARMTDEAVSAASIGAPLMIMRSDGGVMDVREIERRPILTLLSGPAAGVAGALLYENVTDGIFLEVGGTSVDCSAIRAGSPQMRPARIGGHRTMLRTIDSRTLGIAGGSMMRIDATQIVDVGPRSAHIAGCAYAAFLAPEALDGARLQTFAPTAHDPADYMRLVLHGGGTATLTPTCAANFLGYVPPGAFAEGNAESAGRGFALLAQHLGGTPETQAHRILEIAAQKIRACIEALIEDYELPRERLVLVGGGGGAASLVPFVARTLGLDYRIARDAEVISPIGVALALVRDVVERTIVDPTPDDILRIRREASDRAVSAGAAPDRIEVSVEIDTQRNRVRATATGATALVEAAAHGERAEPEQRAAAARSLNVAPGGLGRLALTSLLTAYTCGRDVRVVDERAVVRLALREATLTPGTAGVLDSVLRDAMERATQFGDVGRSLPSVYVIHGGRIADFSGLASIDQAAALAAEEVRGREAGDAVTVITVPRVA
ncbi:MAG: hydantoinase/oxoprolinase family protein, partial [Candidatus Baltobacteraceae bacterium]